MRKLSLIAAATLFVPVVNIPGAAQAKPLNELLLDKGVLGAAEMKKDAGPARVTYDHGTTLEFPSAGAKWKMNARLQSVYTFTDNEESADTHSFDARNVRLDLGGSVLNDEVSFRVTNDFTKDTDSGSSGSKLQDAYIDWNFCPDSAIRAGQWATPYGRQWMTENQNLQFIDRTIAAATYNLGRQEGVGFHGDLGDTYHHQLSVFNGTSIGEGQNTGGTDNKVLVVYNGALDLDGDYDRGHEGDPSSSAGSAGLGFSAYYGEGDFGIGGANNTVTVFDTDRYGASVDLGWRADGLSFQAEGFYDGWSFDPNLSANEDSADNFGAYAQGGYFFVPQEWEFAARFGWVNLDDSVGALRPVYQASGLRLNPSVAATDIYEINAVVSYYLNGHDLKIMTGPSWVVVDTDGADDNTDFRYQVGIFGYF